MAWGKYFSRIFYIIPALKIWGKFWRILPKLLYRVSYLWSQRYHKVQQIVCLYWLIKAPKRSNFPHKIWGYRVQFTISPQKKLYAYGLIFDLMLGQLFSKFLLCISICGFINLCKQILIAIHIFPCFLKLRAIHIFTSINPFIGPVYRNNAHRFVPVI